MFGEGVQMAVGGGVGALLAAAPGRGAGGEQDEGRQVQLPGQFVEELRGERLGFQHPVEAVRVEVGDQVVLGDSGGVQYGRQRVLGGDGVQQGAERVPVGGVTGGEGHGGAQLAEFRGEFPGAGRFGAAAAGQHQVGCARFGDPAGQLPADAAGAAGDQDAAGGPPRVDGGPGLEGVVQAAAQHRAAADRGLVLGLAVGQQRRQQCRAPRVRGRRQIDQAAPAVGVLQGGDPAQAPGLGLAGVRQRVVRPGGHRALGQAPQGGGGLRVAQGLDRRDGGGQPGGYGQVGGVRALVEGEQAEHTGRGALGGQPGQPPGQRGAVRVAGVHEDGTGLGAVLGQCLDGRPHRGVLVVAGRAEQQPAAAEGGWCGLGQRLPADPVAPGLQGAPLAVVPAPFREDRQGGPQGLGAVGVVGQVQGAGQRVEVAFLDGGPEFGLGGVLPLVGAHGARRRAQPVPLPLERVGRQGDGPRRGLGVEPGPPVHRHPGGERLAECRGELRRAARAAPQRRYRHRVGLRRLIALVERRDQYRVRADLDEHPVSGGQQGLDRRAEAYRSPQVGQPVVCVQGAGVQQTAGHRRVEGDLGAGRAHSGQPGPYVLGDPVHLGAVRGVVHLDGPGL
ncbi:hypothetical protein ACZ90_68815 [Streptomyces albus subsp. albus]|nr:hypothetical protein ACZ90_68815 [Streptomyces albus subsp. albus]